MSLKQLYVNGKDPEPAHRLANAQFLHRELPVRLSQRAVELMNLPHGLSDVPGVQQVRELDLTDGSMRVGGGICGGGSPSWGVSGECLRGFLFMFTLCVSLSILVCLVRYIVGCV